MIPFIFEMRANNLNFFHLCEFLLIPFLQNIIKSFLINNNIDVA